MIDPDERLFSCALCLDRGMVETVQVKLRSVIDPSKFIDNKSGSVVMHSCTCDAGIAIESGDLAKKLKPRKRDKPSPSLKLMFQERLRKHPRGIELRDRVDRLIGETTEE